mmetsp:Transcript_26681/g.32881  ORF Transcript_26681/g.32881 Transcript_26681/m.32881 type:complete len:102 (-) Transcript_26681:1963-2268(-)
MKLESVNPSPQNHKPGISLGFSIAVMTAWNNNTDRIGNHKETVMPFEYSVEGLSSLLSITLFSNKHFGRGIFTFLRPRHSNILKISSARNKQLSKCVYSSF